MTKHPNLSHNERAELLGTNEAPEGKAPLSKSRQTTETPTSISDAFLKTEPDEWLLEHELLEETTETPISTSEAAFDPAPGVDLTDAYADRMAVRVERDKIAEGEHLPTTAAPVLDQPGRQTSPELAALAAAYINFNPTRLSIYDASAEAHENFCSDVRRLAASVLSQVNG